MNDTVPQEWIARLENVEYSSSIAVVIFAAGSDTFTLYGDHRMTKPIEAYLGKMVRLHIIHSANWTWYPLEEPNEEVEDG